jgi:hypothetical protein
MAKQVKITEDPEIAAISEVYAALKDLDTDARARVLNYVSGKFNISSSVSISNDKEEIILQPRTEASFETNSVADDELEGISPAGRKWVARNGIKPSKLMSIFSLGIDEIDLVSKSIPGNKKSQRMRNVFLLKGIAAYLGTGTARFTHEQIKEACLHYDAWDGPNFSANFKSLSGDVSGGKDNGYTLTAKGISEATILVKSMFGPES